MRSVEWIVRGGRPSRLFPVGQLEERHTVLLDKREEAWYRGEVSEITALPPGPERTRRLNEVSTVMDAKALLGARIVFPGDEEW